MYAHQRHRYGQEEERLLLWLWQVWKIREVRLWQEVWLRLWVWIWIWEGEMREIHVCLFNVGEKATFAENISDL